MSLWNYKVFHSIVLTGNLRKAAEMMNLTPSAVSHALMKLEKEFGFPLLVRDRNGIELTKYGKEILPYIRSIIEMDQRLHTQVDCISGTFRGNIRIGAFNSVCCCWLPSIIRRMNEEYPKVKISIFQGGYEYMERGLLEGTLDIAFVSLPTKNNISAIPLFRDRLLCATPGDFIPKHKEYITIEELRRQEIIIPGEGSDFDSIAFMKANQIKMERTHNIIEDSAIIALVESGLGVTIIPELVLKAVKGNVNIYPIESGPFRSIGLATQKNELVTPIVNIVVKMVLHYIQSEYPVEQPYFRERKERND